jgi:tryptophan-rich sensory protein
MYPYKILHLKVLFGVILCQAIGISSALIAGSTKNNTWFKMLQKPTWQPPSYVFGPVWTLLYILMGIALGIVLQAPSSTLKTKAIWVFAAQLTLNFAWSILFFKFHSTTLALADILLLICTIGLSIWIFKTFSQTAAWLLVPYLSWVSFATLVNFAIWQLNR